MKQIFGSSLVLRLVFRFRVRETEEEPKPRRVRETKTTRTGMGEGDRGEERARRPSDKVESTRGTATFSY